MIFADKALNAFLKNSNILLLSYLSGASTANEIVTIEKKINKIKARSAKYCVLLTTSM